MATKVALLTIAAQLLVQQIITKVPKRLYKLNKLLREIFSYFKSGGSTHLHVQKAERKTDNSEDLINNSHLVQKIKAGLWL